MVAAPGCTIDGLSITGFGGAAIALEPVPVGSTITGSLGDTVWGNFIGVSQFNPRNFNLVDPANNSDADGVGILSTARTTSSAGRVPSTAT